MANELDTLIAKGMGAVKSVKARFDGLVGIFRRLCEEHGELLVFLERVDKLDGVKRNQLWPRIRAMLLAHETAEARELYAVLREKDELRGEATRHDSEADVMAQLVSRLDALDPGSDEWGAVFSELTGAFEEHVELEESEVFLVAQDAIGEARALELEKRYQATRQQLLDAA